MMPIKSKYFWPVALVVQIIVLQVLSLFPSFVERFYSNGIYPWIASFFRTLFGWIPFSVGDIAYLILIGLLIRWFVRKRKSWHLEWKANLLQLLGFISIGYLLFNMLWGLNYHREKLSVKLGIERPEDVTDSIPYTDAELLAFTEKLIAKINRQHLDITGKDSLKVSIDLSKREVLDGNIKGYDVLKEKYPFLKYDRPSIKSSLLSWPLTYMGFSGYLNPFTGESQSNVLVPRYNLPTIGSHEMAHQIGYASESEANFIGFLACAHHPNPKFRYSGYSLALAYCMGQWEYKDEKTYKRLVATINPGILRNYAESRAFWDSHESFIEVGFKMFYDNFLKLNQQEGLESYSRFVDLLVHYYKDRTL